MKSLGKWFFIVLGTYLEKVQKQIESRSLPKFANTAVNVTINFPRNIANPKNIYIGENVHIGPGCFLLALTEYPTKKMQSKEYSTPTQFFSPLIRLGDNFTATSNAQIAAVKEVIIEDDVMFASNVFVADHSHGYANPYLAYKYQEITKIAPVHIKKGTWLGNGVVVMPGVTIGEYAIIGTHSVVNNDIPAQSIAFGAPAKVHKIWDESKKSWQKVFYDYK